MLISRQQLSIKKTTFILNIVNNCNYFYSVQKSRSTSSLETPQKHKERQRKRKDLASVWAAKIITDEAYQIVILKMFIRLFTGNTIKEGYETLKYVVLGYQDII